MAKGTITAWSCDPTVNGFQTTDDYIIGRGGEQVTEMGVGGSSGGTTTSGLVWHHTNVWAAGKLLATYDVGPGSTGGLHFYFDDALGAHLEQFIDHYYNRLRLHSALGYKTPTEFEAALAAQAVPAMSFPRHGEIHRSWKRRGRPRKGSGDPVSADSPAHQIDESPAGYSLTGWFPPEPVSASPTANQSDAERTK